MTGRLVLMKSFRCGFGALPALGFLLLTAILLLTSASSASAATIERQSVGRAVEPVELDADLRTLPKATPALGQKAEPVPIGVFGSGVGIGSVETASAGSGGAGGAQPDAVTPPEFTNANPNFNGIGYTALVPPDTVGDVGPNHYFQMVNSQFQIFDKQGVSLAGPSNINTLWTAAGQTNQCALNNSGDPIVVYDHLADRWVVSQFAVPNGATNPPTFECVAVSRTSNPVTGGWHLYQFQFNNGFDYPKLSTWPDAYYLSSQRGFSGGSIDVYALDRANMLNGNPATVQQFTVASPALMLLPADLDGAAPPAGTPGFFVRHVDGDLWGAVDRVEVYAFDVDWGVPALSTFTLVAALPAAAFSSDICAGGDLFNNCVPQPGTGTLLETLPHWPMWRLQFRRFGDEERMVFNHTVDVDGNGHAGIRWYELTRTPPGVWGINQQATFSPDGGNPGLADDPHRWMGSIAMDKAGNVALGFSASDGTSLFPEIRYAGREAGDPFGTLSHGEITLVAGQSSQTFNGSRWGDYSSMNVDPVDDCTFWYTTEYLDNLGGGGFWNTRIGAFRFPSCNPVDLAITKTDDQDPVKAGQPLTYDINVRNEGANSATNVVVTDQLPADVTYVTDTDSCTQAPAGTLTCDLDDIAAGGSKSFTVRVAVRSDAVVGTAGTKTIENTASVDSDQLDSDESDNSTSEATIVEDLADLAIAKECNPAQPTPAGQNVDCTLFVDNHGPSDARSARVSDRVFSSGQFTISNVTTSQGSCSPPSAITGGQELQCSLGNLAAASPSSSGRATISYRITGSEAQDLNNIASVTSDTPDPNLENNEATKSFTFRAVSDLSITKADAPDPVVAGRQLTYTLEILNNGPSTAQNVVVDDNVPAGVSIESVSASGGATCKAGTPGDPFKPTTCAFGTLAPGATRTMTIGVRVLPDTTGQLNNDARVSSDTFDNDNSDDLATVSTQVTEEADLRLTKADSPDPVIAGTALDYTLELKNHGGPSHARNVRITDELPAGVRFTSSTISNGTGTCDHVVGDPRKIECELNDLAAGQHITVILHTLVASSVPHGTALSNRAVASSQASDPNPADNDVTQLTAVKAVADLVTAKTSDADVYKPSATIAYTINVSNAGPSDAQQVVLVDDLPPPKVGDYVFDTAECSRSENTLTCQLGTIASGASKSFNLYFRVKGSKGKIVNKATASSLTNDPDTLNNSSTRVVLVKGGI